jgi:hypothetical protein
VENAFFNFTGNPGSLCKIAIHFWDRYDLDFLIIRVHYQKLKVISNFTQFSNCTISIQLRCQIATMADFLERLCNEHEWIYFIFIWFNYLLLENCRN